MVKYGVKLVLYRAQRFNMWVYDEKRFETTNREEAEKVVKEYKNRNPDGYYIVEEIIE